MTLIIRPYRDASDRAGMTAVYSTAWHATYDPVDGPAAIDRVIAALLAGDPPEMFALPVGDLALVAEANGRLIGGIRGHPRDDEVHLSGLYVAPDAQGNGIGSALLAELIRWFPRNTPLRADVRPTSAVARRFYAAHGFEEINRARTDVGGGHWVDTIELRRGGP